ncbi:integral membrane [Pyrenophora seminiperda CCB06]|uniref:Integral membrane n=1 Tax=Pyrenophora seminiperda CCB06 TaxID=1302712 RepID=A0A3M7M017_9PLEO|nr:integral membrane [Pyrenophora seminiperda CCB06]
MFTTEHLYINRHVWDIPPNLYVPERKITFTIYLLYVISGGLIKSSILLFYRRLDNRCITRAFRLATWINILAIFLFIFAFTVVLLTACAPTEAFWLQFDITRQLEGYAYTCWVNEGDYILSASIVSAVQDGVAAFLPTLLYWNLKIAKRQKLGLGAIFALGYVVCGVAGVRSYFIWKIFNHNGGDYDSTWKSWPVWVLTVVEVHLGMICASAPALKVFCCHYCRVVSEWYGAGSRGVSEMEWSMVSATKESSETVGKDVAGRSMVDVEAAIVLGEEKIERVERSEVVEGFVFS